MDFKDLLKIDDYVSGWWREWLDMTANNPQAIPSLIPPGIPVDSVPMIFHEYAQARNAAYEAFGQNTGENMGALPLFAIAAVIAAIAVFVGIIAYWNIKKKQLGLIERVPFDKLEELSNLIYGGGWTWKKYALYGFAGVGALAAASKIIGGVK